MNRQDYTNAFGKAPESFKRRIATALLQTGEGEKVKKFSLRFVLLMAALLLVLMGAVYAASRDWRILDFLTGWYAKAPVGNLRKAMEENKVQQSYEFGEYSVTLSEAVADGKFVYIAVNVSMKEGNNAYLIPAYLSPSTLFSNAVDIPMYVPANAEKYFYDVNRLKSVSKITPEAVSTSGDRRSFLAAANQEGKRLYCAGFWLESGQGTRNMRITSFTVLSDGSVSFVLGGREMTEEKQLDVKIHFDAGEVNLSSGQIKETISRTIPLSLRVLDAMDRRTVNLHGATIEGTEMVLDRLELYLTPLTLHYELYFTLPQSPGQTQSPYFVDFLNEQGKLISPGLSITMVQKPLGGGQYVQYGSMLLDAVPDAVIFRGRSLMDFQKYGQITVKLK